MEMQLISLRDSKGEAFTAPKAHKTIGEAERFLQHLVNNPAEGNFLHLYPEDFDMYHLGSFDDQTGKMKLFDSPRHLTKAISFRKP